MIRFSFNGSDKRVALALRERGQKLVAALREALDLSMLELVRRIQEKLSGEVLHQRSGKLIGSVHKETTAVAGTQIIGRVTAAGGPAWYGRVHEFGGTRAYDIYPVKKRALAFMAGGGVNSRSFYFKQGSRRGSLRPKMYGKFAEAGGVVVKSVHHPPLPRRSFMATSQEELRGKIKSNLLEAAAKALRG